VCSANFDDDIQNPYIHIMAKAVLKPVVWVGSTRKDLRAFPQAVQRVVGQALFVAQLGETPPDAKPLKGFGGGGVVELIENHRADTYGGLYGSVHDDYLRAARVSKEIETRHRYPQERA
jgi:phage-related protein